MTPGPSAYRRHRFPAEIISHAVWLYLVFSLSLRDIELVLAEHGVVVTHESIRNWCQKFGAEFAKRLRRRRPRRGDTWHLDDLPGVRHRISRYLNNRAENSHRPTLRRFAPDRAETPPVHVALPPPGAYDALLPEFAR